MAGIIHDRFCGKRPMKSYAAHMLTKSHLNKAACFDALNANQNEILPGLANQNPLPNNDPPPLADAFMDTEDPAPRSDTPERPPSPLSIVRAIEFLGAEKEQASNPEDSELEINDNTLAEAVRAMGLNVWDEEANEAMDDAALEADLRDAHIQESNDWYPFRKKEASLQTQIGSDKMSILLLTPVPISACRCIVDCRIHKKHPIKITIPPNSLYFANL
ncbi:uncharacterized protein MELLADRAFT_93662 [Melampsora larici-populina 98AG31]|uniref:Uncharacterized protein n=1 Tax=Melampsora larici-populina (strain 98AG31 / pathotype 3-4-7) TaxID=747676 RepID=F4RA11_MELLP|nr:uncharacterized protein MELLADRAFT_93662 [Melampsora larici-populina 98AG31]EGG10649.1 hypothetical protein MELLADRAFT_93662 [Melampsora larici-populina 98AG31]